MFNEEFKIELEKQIVDTNVKVLVCQEDRLILTRPINDVENMTIGLHPLEDGTYPTLEEAVNAVYQIFT